MRRIAILTGANLVIGIAFAWLVKTYAMTGATYAAHRLRSFEVGDVIYERIGIRCFAAVVSGFPWRFLNLGLGLDHGRQSLDHFLGQSRLAEATHVVAFLLAIPFLGFAIAQPL